MIIEDVYDSLAGVYDEHFQDSVSRAEDEAIFNMVNTTLSGTMCDLGCGTGLVLEYLKIPPDEYTGVDISRGMLERAQNKFPDHRFIHADIQGNISIEDNCFNSVLAAFGTMSYCNAPYAVVEEIKRLLRPGGAFFIMLCGEPYQHRNTHIINSCEDVYFRTYVPTEIAKMFQDFTEVEIYGFSPTGLNVDSDITTDIMTESITTDAMKMQERYFLIVTGRKPDA